MFTGGTIWILIHGYVSPRMLMPPKKGPGQTELALCCEIASLSGNRCPEECELK